MNIKSCLLAGAMVFAFAGNGMASGMKADLMNSAAESAYTVVADNDSGGFWNNIFNKSKGGSGSKPLYLDKGKSSGSSTTARKAKIKPFDMGSQYGGKGKNGPKDRIVGPEMQEQARARQQADIDEQTEQARAAGQLAMNRSRQAIMARMEADERTAVKGTKAAEKSNKKMVYDPEKVWTYDPNKSTSGSSGNTGTAPRIYNTR